jgi:hypothetical protein
VAVAVAFVPDRRPLPIDACRRDDFGDPVGGDPDLPAVGPVVLVDEAVVEPA